MKRFMWLAPVIALVAIAVYSAPRESDENGTVKPEAVTISHATRGVVFMTAAVNSNATIASCFLCLTSNTKLVSTGEYQINFTQNVQAANGWSRWVQVDTLSTGSINNVSCTTADRAGVTTAVWVACFNNETGAPTNTSFFLFLAR